MALIIIKHVCLFLFLFLSTKATDGFLIKSEYKMLNVLMKQDHFRRAACCLPKQYQTYIKENQAFYIESQKTPGYFEVRNI